MRRRWQKVVLSFACMLVMSGVAIVVAQQPALPTQIPHVGEQPVTPVRAELPGTQVGKELITPQTPVASVDLAPKHAPGVELEWAGPASAKVNHFVDYTLVVRNTSEQSLHKVVVQVRLPQNTIVSKTTPRANLNDGVYFWELDTLAAKESATYTVGLKRSTRGEFTCQAWVTLTGSTVMKASMQQPELQVMVKAPEKVLVGDTYVVESVVKNTGDTIAEDVVLTPKASQRPPMRPVTLKPGESHTIRDEFVAHAGGQLKYDSDATGADDLKAANSATVLVQAPKLSVTLAGPEERLIGKTARYTLTVGNCGDVPVTGVVVREHIPAGFRAVAGRIANAAMPDADTLHWTVGDLQPAEVKTYEFDMTCTKPGSHSLRATASGERGISAKTEHTTTVEGIPALRMEMVDKVDPVERDGETSYEVKVVNTGTKADCNVIVSFEVPDEMQLVSGTGPTRFVLGANKDGLVSIAFNAIAELPPKTEAVFKVTVKAKKPGDVRFRALLNSKYLETPVVKEESTRVYGE